MFGSLGLGELCVILAIVGLIFGPKRLPQMGKALGESIREFRGVGKQLKDIHNDIEED